MISKENDVIHNFSPSRENADFNLLNIYKHSKIGKISYKFKN